MWDLMFADVRAILGCFLHRLWYIMIEMILKQDKMPFTAVISKAIK